jgi:hypothetical protein
MTPKEIRAMLKKVYTNQNNKFEGIQFARWWWNKQTKEFRAAQRETYTHIQASLADLPDEELVLQYAIYKM